MFVCGDVVCIGCDFVVVMVILVVAIVVKL